MAHSFYMPTRIISGRGCVKEKAAKIKALGNRALIVTYPVSRTNGSLDDVIAAIESQGMSHLLFDNCRENPSWQLIRDLGKQAYASGCDVVIGIGGGSAIDAAKAAAILCANDIPIETLYSGKYPNPPLPIVTVPTTAGTGAEVTFNGVLAMEGEKNKKSFGDERLCPKLAFLDAAYTQSVPLRIARETAVDALTHAVEGYLSAKSTPFGKLFCEECFRIFALCYDALVSGELTFVQREMLQYAATMSGIIIVQERTLAPHAMSYALTCVKGAPHGRATGVLTAAFVEHCKSGVPERVNKLLNLLNLTEASELYDYLGALLGEIGECTDADIDEFVAISAKAAAAKPNPMPVDEAAVRAMFVKSLRR